MTQTCVPGAWRRALVSDSWAIRYAASWTPVATGTGAPRRSTSICEPLAWNALTSSSRSASPGSGRSGTGSSSGWRSSPTVARSSPSAARLVSLICPSAWWAASGLSRIRWCATPACALTRVMWWATTSCSSRAIRRRFSVTARRASCSRVRSARSARASTSVRHCGSVVIEACLQERLLVTTWIPIVASGLSGAAVTLLGVLTGGAISSRAQRRQWNRDKQIDASTVLIQESTRMQLTLRQRWKYGDEPDWTAWNQALEVMSLVGTSDSIAAARQMDRVFWHCNARIRRGWKPDEDAWATVRDEMESARLGFINVARHKLTESGKPLNEVPVARPSQSMLNEMYGPPVDVPDDSAQSANDA
jgi:hypothetical protein